MRLPAYPQLHDPGRLREVARLGVDREVERAYLADIVDTVADRLDAPFAIVTGLLSDAQVFLAGRGPVPAWIAEVGGTPIEWAFCCPLLSERAARTVSDFTTEPEFRDNPLVTVEGIRSYAGAPLISGSGLVLGGLCALDVRPRQFGTHLAELQELADEVVRRIEAEAEASAA
ncbi:GAF domain-containing protein [Actinoplanes sp. NPDC024001]|uniref:GAF domain-containing protein n=1 Tax=Actinoplanes sp. NPDC024001 TaxID=3154598 RepID=UPI0033D739A0